MGKIKRLPTGICQFRRISDDNLLGFSEADVREMIRYYQEAGQIAKPEDEIIAEMKPWYDN